MYGIQNAFRNLADMIQHAQSKSSGTQNGTNEIADAELNANNSECETTNASERNRLRRIVRIGRIVS